MNKSDLQKIREAITSAVDYFNGRDVRSPAHKIFNELVSQLDTIDRLMAESETPKASERGIPLDALVKCLQTRADNAYCEYMDRLRRNECLGWEIKIERGLFREPELKAHKAAALVRELLTPNT